MGSYADTFIHVINDMHIFPHCMSGNHTMAAEMLCNVCAFIKCYQDDDIKLALDFRLQSSTA